MTMHMLTHQYISTDLWRLTRAQPTQIYVPEQNPPQGLREVAAIVARSLPIIFEMSWGSGDILMTEKEQMPSAIRAQRDLGNCRPTSFTSFPGIVL